MPLESPKFIAKPIGEDNIGADNIITPATPTGAEVDEQIKGPNKTKKTRKNGKPKTKIIKAEAESPENLVRSANQAALSKSLNTIYQNETGELPNMKEITIKKSNPIIKFFSTLIIVGALLSAAAWAGYYFVSAPGNFSNDQVMVKINGPVEVSLGALNTYEISYINDQNQPLQNAVLQIQYPIGFVYKESSISANNTGHTEWRLNNVPAHGQGSVSVSGKNYGSLNQPQLWRVVLNYKPQNINSSLQQTNELQTTIGSSPLALTITGPEKADVGAPINYNFVVNNSEEWNLPQVDLVPNFPTNFKIVSSTPNLIKNRWQVFSYAASTTVSTSPQMSYALTGVWSSSSSTDSAPLGATLFTILPQTKQSFVVAATNVTTTLVKSGVNFNLAINGSLTNFSAKPGDLLTISLRLLNSSNQTLTNGSIQLNLEAPSIKKQSILDWANLKDDNNSAVQGMQKNDTTRLGQATWTAKEVTALAKIKPGAEVSLDLQLPIKSANSFDINSLTQTLINATAIATFTGANGTQTITANPIDINLNSDLKIETRDTIKTERGVETHQITWVLNNTIHALNNLTVTAAAFGDVSFASEPAPAGAVTFDPAEKTITWKINEMPEGIDVLALPFTLTLNTKNPTQNTLLSKVKVTATDTVTGDVINLIGDEILLNQ